MPLPYRWQWRVDRWKASLRGFFGGGETQPRPKLCPACGSLVGVNATRCHECGTNLRFSLAAWSKGLSELVGGRAPVSTLLLVANLLFFGVSLVMTLQAGSGGGLSILWGMNGESLYRLGANWRPAVESGQWFRLVTSMFLHGGLIHIGFNMMVLMDVGPIVEELYGSARFFFVYTLAGIVGAAFSAFNPLRSHPALSIGASGALLGLIGVMIAVTTKRGGIGMRELRSRLISWVVSIFAIGFFIGGIDNSAHLGGLVSGFGIGKLLADREPMNPAERRTAYALGWIAGIVTLVSFALMILHFKDQLP